MDAKDRRIAELEAELAALETSDVPRMPAYMEAMTKRTLFFMVPAATLDPRRLEVLHVLEHDVAVDELLVLGVVDEARCERERRRKHLSVT